MNPKRKILLRFLVFLLLLLALALPAYADNNALILRGVLRIIASAFEVPRSMLVDSSRVMFPFGIVTGAVGGSLRTVVGTLAGALDVAKGGAPYAKYMIFFV